MEPIGAKWFPQKAWDGAGRSRGLSAKRTNGFAEATPTSVFRASPGKMQTLAALIYGGQWSSPEPAAASGSRPCRPPLKGEVSAKRTEGFKTEDLGRSNLWRPMVVDRMRGSKWLSALPTGNADQRFPGESRKTAEFGNLNLWFPNSSREPAAASGSRHCRPADR